MASGSRDHEKPKIWRGKRESVSPRPDIETVSKCDPGRRGLLLGTAAMAGLATACRPLAVAGQAPLGEVPWFSADEADDLEHAITAAIAEHRRVVLVSREIPAGGAQTVVVPADITLLFTPGGRIAITDGQIVRIHGAVDAGYHRIFSGPGTVELQPGAGAASAEEGVFCLPTVNVCWFGACGDGVTDDTAAFQAAIDSLPRWVQEAPYYEDGGGVVQVPASTRPYLVSSLRVERDQAPALLGAGTIQTRIRQHDDATEDLLSVRSFRGFRIADLRLERAPGAVRRNTGLDAGPDPKGDKNDPVRGYRFENVWFLGFKTGFRARFLQRPYFSDLYALKNQVGIEVTAATTGGVWRDCVARENDEGIVVQREARSMLTPVFQMHGGIIESNTKIGIVLDSVPSVTLDGVYFETNPIGIEVRKTISDHAVRGHTYRKLTFSNLGRFTAFQISKEGYKGGEVREFAILDPDSGDARWDLSGLLRSLVVAPHAAAFENSNFSIALLRWGGPDGAGLGTFGNTYSPVGTLPAGDARPNTRSVNVWRTQNVQDTAYRGFYDSESGGRTLTVVVDDSHTRFLSGQGNLRLANGADWNDPVRGSSISFVYIAEMKLWIETSRSA